MLEAQHRVRGENLFLLAGVGTSGDPHRPLAEIGAAQRAPLFADESPAHVELHVADHMGSRLGRADRDEALGILGRLGADHVGCRDGVANKLPSRDIAAPISR